MTKERKTVIHTIVVDLWRLFLENGNNPEFTDAWWEKIIQKFNDYCEKYKGTEHYNCCCYIAHGFLEEYEVMKNDKGIEN